MKNILLFTDTPLWGGAEQQMALLGKFVNREKFSLSLACLPATHLNPLCQKFIEYGLPVYRLPFRHKHDPRCLIPLIKLIKTKNIDLMHLHLWNPASCRYGFIACRLAKTPIVITEHDPFRLPKLKAKIKKFLLPDKLSIIAISKENEGFLKNEYKEITSNIFYVPNGIDIDEWTTFAPEAGKKSNEFIIANVATLHKRKGQDILIKAFAEVCKNFPAMRLRLVGDGPDRNYYESLAKQFGAADKIEFLGQCRDIPEILAESDLFIMPSRREAFGMAILEAGMMKVPVIAANVGGIPDIIENEKTGLLVEKENVEELAAAIQKMLENENLMNELKENLYQKVESEFSAKRMAELTEKVYDKSLI